VKEILKILWSLSLYERDCSDTEFWNTRTWSFGKGNSQEEDEGNSISFSKFKSCLKVDNSQVMSCHVPNRI
jgi:hypothetical protein